jgi:hypothetical protein
MFKLPGDHVAVGASGHNISIATPATGPNDPLGPVCQMHTTHQIS